MKKLFVAIAGNIGAGKTTLTRMLADHLGFEAHFELVDTNPYLEDFYQDMRRWAFPLQTFFLNHRYLAHRQIADSHKSAVQDRTIYEDAHIFARNLYEKGLMEERDYQNYKNLFQALSSLLDPPDLMVYLRKSVPELQKRIVQRGRSFEKEIPESYLLDLNRYYDEWMDGFTLCKKIVIETDSLDFVKNRRDFDGVLDKILGQVDQKDLFLK